MRSFMERLKVLLFSCRSLTFNSGISRAVVIDTIFEPVFWVIDHFARILGPAFVLLVVGLTTSVVVIYYSYLLPVILHYSTPWVVVHLVTAHWLLINIVFHYFKVVFTSPGIVPQVFKLNLLDPTTAQYATGQKLYATLSLFIPGCLVLAIYYILQLGKCVLKMDHHCPWINNCVGHFNHKYFILFCIFMCLGTLYVTVSSRTLFVKHFFHGSNSTIHPGSNIGSGQNSSLLVSKLKLVDNSWEREDNGSQSEHRCVLFVFMLCSAVTLALGILTGWHCRLVSNGETSIEWYINKDDAKMLRKQGLVFRNPYNFGIWNNWRMLLGLVDGRSWLCILLPSSHPPFGDGVTWPPLPADAKEDGKGKLHIV